MLHDDCDRQTLSKSLLQAAGQLGWRRKVLAARVSGERSETFNRELLDVLDDETLNALEKYFDLHLPACSWPNPGLKLFVSHVAASRAKLHPLKAEFATYGANFFLAHDDIEGGAPWRTQILNALQSMDALLVVHSDGFSQSVFCNQEVGIAIGRGVPIISLMDGETPCGFLSDMQGDKVRDGAEGELAGLVFDRLQPLIGERISETLARALKSSASFDDAGKVTKRLLKCPVITDRAFEDLNLALRFNSQVYKSNSNEARLTRLFVSHGKERWQPDLHPAEERAGIEPVVSKDDEIALALKEIARSRRLAGV